MEATHPTPDKPPWAHALEWVRVFTLAIAVVGLAFLAFTLEVGDAAALTVFASVWLSTAVFVAVSIVVSGVGIRGYLGLSLLGYWRLLVGPARPWPQRLANQILALLVPTFLVLSISYTVRLSRFG